MKKVNWFAPKAVWFNKPQESVIPEERRLRNKKMGKPMVHPRRTYNAKAHAEVIKVACASVFCDRCGKDNFECGCSGDFDYDVALGARFEHNPR